MNPNTYAGIIILLLLALPGCTSEAALKGGVYEAAYRKQCLDREGKPNCDPTHQNYEDYKKDRDELPRRGR